MRDKVLYIFAYESKNFGQIFALKVRGLTQVIKIFFRWTICSALTCLRAYRFTHPASLHQMASLRRCQVSLTSLRDRV